MVKLFDTLIYLLELTGDSQAIWIITPLAITTALMILYFGMYKEERAGWDSYVANTFVLVFVALALIRYIIEIENGGTFNLINYWGKSLAVIILFSIGIIVVKFNFEHLLPKKITRILSSPITVNLIAYAIILFVFSKMKTDWTIFASLLIIVVVLSTILILIRKPIAMISNYVKKEKKKERILDAKEAMHQINELREELRYRDKELRKIKLKEVDGQKKEASTVKKILNK